MAMTVDQRTPYRRRCRDRRCMARDKFAEGERRARKRAGLGVAREKGRQLVTEGQNTAWFEADERHAAPHVRAKRRECLAQSVLRAREHPLVVERASAAQMLTRNGDAKSRALENFDRCYRDLGLEEIREGVREQQHFAV